MPIHLGQALTTDPTPVVLALATSHMHAASVLLDGDLTLGAMVGAYLVSPTFVHGSLSLST